MSAYRRRAILYAIGGILIVWLAAGTGWLIFRHAKVTAEKVAAFLHSVDLSKLSGEARAKALRDLARQMAALPIEERRRARLDGEWERWFTAMTDDEKGTFIEATLPSGFKQMLASFEQLPEDKRKRAIEDAFKELKRTRDSMDGPEAAESPWRPGAARPPELSKELQNKVVKLGLQSYYTESSAQTKAELAPLLEEMQRSMENGRLFRQRP